MSVGNGNGRISKYNRQVAEKAGLKKGEVLPYAPDNFDALVRVMAIPGEIHERTRAWLIFRGPGNQSLKAIHLYSAKGEPPVETELDQRDCALELAWVEAGHRAEWLDAPLELFREEAVRRGIKPIDKSAVSRGFQFNRDRGSMEAETGQTLVYNPAPNAEKFSAVRELCRTKGETVSNITKLIEWAKISYARELQEWQVARSREQQLLRFLTARYKKEKGSHAAETNGGTSLEALEALEPNEAAGAPVPVSVIDKNILRTDGRTEESAPPVEAVRPSGWEDQKFRKDKLLAYLTQNFDRPTPPDDVVLNPLASLISDEPLFLQFQKACRGFKPQNGWKGFLQIGKAVVANHGNYTQAKAKPAIAVDPGEDRLMQMLRDRNESERKEREARASK